MIGPSDVTTNYKLSFVKIGPMVLEINNYEGVITNMGVDLQCDTGATKIISSPYP